MGKTNKWIKEGRTVSPKGTTITYRYVGTMYTVESRKRQIPHANGDGFWEYTSYFILYDGKQLIEKHSLKDAKEYAERLDEWT